MNKGMLKVLMLSVFSTASFAAVAEGPFTVETESGTTLPTTVIAEGVSYAFYTVTNVSGQDLYNNSAKYLPENVTQEIYDPNYCGATFSLDDEESCLLKLMVTGEVVVDDPNDPANQVIVCNEAGVFCNAAADLLVVEQVSALAAGLYCYKETCNFQANPPVGGKTLLSQREGDAWGNVVVGGNLPADNFDFWGLGGVACADNFCMGTGVYVSNQAEFDYPVRPLLVMTANGASDWSYQFDSSDDLYGGYAVTSCSETLCVAGGEACFANGDPEKKCFAEPLEPREDGTKAPLSTGSSGTDPLLAYSSNGEDWALFDTVTEILEHEHRYIGDGFIEASGCSDTACIVAGGYLINIEANIESDSTILLQTLLLVSDTDGDDWEYIAPVCEDCEFFGYDFVTGSGYYAATCSNQFCLAGGASGEARGDPGVLVLAVQRGDAEWEVAFDFIVDADQVLTDEGIINSANCFEEFCLIGGYYFDSPPGASASFAVPYLVQSKDGFEKNWEYVLYHGHCGSIRNCIETNKLPFEFKAHDFSEITGVSCDENVCAAVGYYTRHISSPKTNINGLITPLLLQTTDYGSSWQVVDLILSSLPADFEYGELTAVSCSAGICVTVGEYTPNGAQFPKPLLLQSINGGPWVSIEELPYDFQSRGSLLGTNAPGAGNASASFNASEFFEPSVKRRPLI